MSDTSLWRNGLTLNTCSLQYSPCQDLNQSICTWYVKDKTALGKQRQIHTLNISSIQSDWKMDKAIIFARKVPQISQKNYRQTWSYEKRNEPHNILKKLLYRIFSHCPKSNCKIRRESFLCMFSIIVFLHQVSTVRVLKACLCVHILKSA